MGGASRGGGSRALRLLLLLVLTLAAVEFLFGGILESSPLRTYLYKPIYISTQPTIRNSDKSPVTWPKTPSTKGNPETNSHAKNTTEILNKFNDSVNVTEKKMANITQMLNELANVTVQSGVKDTLAYNGLGNVTVQSGVTDTPAYNGLGNVTVQSGVKDTPAYNGISMFIAKIPKTIKNLVTTEEVVRKTELPPPLCAQTPPDLGPITVNKTNLELDFVEKRFPEIQWGGMYAPPNCTARHKVAIIVPYRDREQHLAVFLNHMHPFLMKQQIEYGIFVIEQEGNKEFNRAKLMNVGFVESQRLQSGWQCFVFHDIDLLPLDTRNMYSCPRQPRHMSASVDKLLFKLPYEEIFGGVSAITLEQFTKVNGFSNKYWGWGGEDDDMFCRLNIVNYHVARYKMSIARYAMLNHVKAVANPKRRQLLSQTSKTFQKDGLSTLQYELIKVVQCHLYTHIVANIDERSLWMHLAKLLFGDDR